MKYQCEVQFLDERTQWITVSGNDQGLSFRQVLDAWSSGDVMTDIFTQLVSECGFDAVFWEMPPLTQDRLNNRFECVLINSPALAKLHVNPEPFREYFGGPESIVAFRNLGADALLVAPAPVPEQARYTHLALFCRTAPSSLSQRFWQRLGQIVLSQVGDVVTWVSTAGLGVGWLHARLDSRPKYYSHTPYRRWTENRGEPDA